MKRLALVILIALFALPLWGQDSMPVYLLVKVTPAWNPDDPMVYGKGFPVHADITNQYVGKQVLPDFVQFVITDADNLETVRDAYTIPWKREIDWEFVSHDFATDTHTLKAFTKPEFVSASGKNRLTRDGVESFLNRWNAVVDSISLGEVTFTVNALDAIISEGFWGRTVPDGVLTELSYTEATGIHSITIDYGLIPAVPLAELAALITSNGCTITSNKPAQKKATFSCSRDNVFAQFKQSVKDAIDGTYAIRRWNFLDAAIDAAISAGGSLEVTKAQVTSYIHNRITD
jgi:hypothetical protein